MPSYTGSIEGFAATNPATNGEVKFDADSPESRAYASYLEAQQADLGGRGQPAAGPLT